ncbi:hypothetical protein Scep_018130 [Stephania cephalantha]|uniref:Uncharacterized protein n=1 Tax=Stephania cephalantha TaxID=152367 RepID=A0AAP0NUA0_9MAGN
MHILDQQSEADLAEEEPIVINPDAEVAEDAVDDRALAALPRLLRWRIALNLRTHFNYVEFRTVRSLDEAHALVCAVLDSN